jgi:DNA-binding Xre family transcriptional regulator
MATTTKKMTDNPVVQRILGLIREKGKKEKDLTAFLKISSGGISKWKYDGSFVYLKYIDEICEFLDTTPNYLFWGFDEEERLTPVEEKIVHTYRSLDDGRKKCIRDMMDYLAENNDKK